MAPKLIVHNSVQGIGSGSIGSKRQSDVAFDLIARAVVRCELAPGMIVSEAELSSRFELQRAAVRAAVDRLSMMGFMRPVRRRGYLIRPITLRDVNDLFQMRQIIESAAVRLAAGHVDEVALRRLNRVRKAGYKPGDRESEARFLQVNSEFHLTVAVSTGNDRLVRILGHIFREMERLFHFGLALRNRSDEMQHEHQALIEALAQGRADEAERVIQEELASSKAMVLDALMSSEALLDFGISAGENLVD